MPNFQISDLPLATLPLSLTGTFFEVQTVEGGEDVSRKVAGDNLTFAAGVIQGTSVDDPSIAAGTFNGAQVFQNANGDVLVDIGNPLQVIATEVDLILAFAIPRSAHSSADPVGAKLLWDADGDGTPDGGAILIDRNRDGNFGEPHEIRVFGEA